MVKRGTADLCGYGDKNPPRSKSGNCLGAICNARHVRRQLKQRATPEGRAMRRVYMKEYYALKDPRILMLAGAKARARKLGLAFDLSVEDIVIPVVCPALGIELTRGQGGTTVASPSLDRILPDKGYTRGNVQVLSYLANAMKNSADPETLCNFAKWILKEYERT